MKRLLSPGVTAVSSGRSWFAGEVQRFAQGPVVLSGYTPSRPFGSHGAFGDGTRPGVVFVFFTLADTVTYSYAYQVSGDKASADLIAAWLNTAFPTGIPPTYGGILFNAAVRSKLIEKLPT